MNAADTYVWHRQRKDGNKTGNLGTPHATADILRKYGITLQKKYGQNFLTDGNILNGIVESAEIGPDDYVIEIGPGIGTMTQLLAERAKGVTAVEIDSKLIPVLQDTLAEYANITVINQDIMKVDLKKIAEEKNNGRPVKVVANLPYYITTPIIMGLLEGNMPYDSITVMVQKEAAQRMQAAPGSKIYGALSLAIQYHTEPEIKMNVPAACFIPRPKVDSTVIRLTKRPEPPVNVTDTEFMFALIRASFNQRRKTLANGIGNAGGLCITRQQAADTLAGMGLSQTVRGEQLSLEQFALLSDELGQIRKVQGM